LQLLSIFTFDINVSLLLGVVEYYIFNLEIEDLVEIVRAMDILGAERRFKEYEVVLYIKLKETTNESEWERRLGERIPVNFYQHMKEFNYGFNSYSQLIGNFGSPKLIEYFLQINIGYDKNQIFNYICKRGSLDIAQWMLILGGIMIYNEAFRFASWFWWNQYSCRE
jgi:hypothetical protein